VRHDDIPTFIKWAEDEDMMRHLRIGPIAPDSEADLKEWIDNLHKSNTIQAFVVRPLEDDTTAGFVNLMDINWMNGSSILAIAIDSAYQGKGYGREAMEMILRFAFHELNLYRVGLGVFSYNARAMRLYESIGFVREGTIRGAVHRDGQRFDMLMYGILCDEWAQARKDVLPPPIGS
jgi:RimJ/RimL family protein N-acetyltransferase